jgi:hypothetical protein
MPSLVLLGAMLTVPWAALLIVTAVIAGYASAWSP